MDREDLDEDEDDDDELEEEDESDDEESLLEDELMRARSWIGSSMLCLRSSLAPRSAMAGSKRARFARATAARIESFIFSASPI